MGNEAMIKVEKWVSWEEATSLRDSGAADWGSFGGWFTHGLRWKDFLPQFDLGGSEEEEREAREHYEALRTEILRRRLRVGGDWHQESEQGVPVFSDGGVATFTMRAWGDLLAAVWSTEDDKDYSYMDFYISGLGSAEDSPPEI
jgi:hypothetical protein